MSLRDLFFVLALTAFSAALTAAPASASRPYESQITEANGSGLSNPHGLTVDGSDNLWVSDTGSSRVSKFDSSGLYQAQNDGTGSWAGSAYIESLAFSEVAGKVFVSDSNADDVWGLNVADATYAGTDLNSGLGGGCCFIRVAADNSGAATDGDLYVSTGSSVVRITSSGAAANFSASQSYISGNKLTGPFSSPGALAVGPGGNLYVADGAKVYVFEPSGALLEEITEFEGSPLGSIRAIAVDPSNENVLVAEAGAVNEFTSSGDSIEKIVEANGAAFESIQGLAIASTGTLYVADGGGQVVDVFGPGIILPKITNEPVTDQTHTSGTLNASIDLNGGPNVSSCEFQYGLDTSYGSSAPCSPATPYSGPTSVSTDLTGLTTESTYHYRVVLTTANGTRKGPDQTFTPHAVLGLKTDPVSQVTASTATLNASFTGEGEDVHYYFEWSSDESFDNQSAAPPGVLVPSASGAQSVSFALSQLQPETPFHYRIVASNDFGTTVGQTQTFSTQGRYQFSTYYGSAGSGDGQFNGPKDVAVDASTGAIYVADDGNHRVVKLSSSGDFIAAWGWGVGGGGGFEVCSSGCQAGIAGSGPGQFDEPEFIEVDNSSGPSNGDVYVADEGRGDVQKFDPSGDLVSTWGEGGAIDFSDGGPIQGITVSNEGSLFVGLMGYWTEVGQDGVYRNDIPTGSIGDDHFMSRPDGNGIDIGPNGNFYQASVGGVDVSPPGAARDAIERYPESEHGPNGDPTGLAVNRSTGDLYTGHGTFLYQFLASQSECFHLGNPFGAPTCAPSAKIGQGQLDGALGLALAPSTGILYAANSGADNIALFAPLPLPEVTTKSAVNVGAASATLRGHVDPAGPASIVDCYFEYGTDSNLDLGTVPCDQSTPILDASDVSAEVTGLSSFTSYRYRLVAAQSDGQGFPGYGAELTFTPVSSSPPSIGATSFADVTQTTARLDGTINPNLALTTYVFQYGTTSNYGRETLASGSIGDDNSFHSVSAAITELSPATAYHFRVVAVNFSGTTLGPDMTFVTPSDVNPTLPSGSPAAPVVTPIRGGSSSNCAKVADRAEKYRQKAVSLRRRAKRLSDPGRARAVRRKADRVAKKAQRLSEKAKSCAEASGKASR
jgi:DNA-binding beta-propeller fold protein YncE